MLRSTFQVRPQIQIPALLVSRFRLCKVLCSIYMLFCLLKREPSNRLQAKDKSVNRAYRLLISSTSLRSVVMAFMYSNTSISYTTKHCHHSAICCRKLAIESAPTSHPHMIRCQVCASPSNFENLCRIQSTSQKALNYSLHCRFSVMAQTGRDFDLEITSYISQFFDLVTRSDRCFQQSISRVLFCPA